MDNLDGYPKVSSFGSIGGYIKKQKRKWIGKWYLPWTLFKFCNLITEIDLTHISISKRGE